MNLEKTGQTAKEMSRYTKRFSTAKKDKILLACADALEADCDYILEANKKDMDLADPARAAFFDRLMLNPDRVKQMAEGLRKVAGLEDPAGEVLYMKNLPNGLQIGERRVPIGVIGMIYEARPNVTVDSFGLCFKAGNSCILRGGSEALNSNGALVQVLRRTIERLGYPKDIVQFIDDPSREIARQFMGLNQYVDVLIPRGGAGLIKSTVENSTVPVIETGVGNCHIFVDDSADLDQAQAIIINAKTQRPSVCNACEKLLIHKRIANDFLPRICNALTKCGVEIRGDGQVCDIINTGGCAGSGAGAQLKTAYCKDATEEDWYTEFLDLIIAIKIVEDADHAMDHIGKYSSGHTEAILTKSYENAMRFTSEVDSAAVFVNASTRFTDGEEFGLGAEIGISTQKLHARGPMGLKALTTTKFIIFGNGQTR